MAKGRSTRDQVLLIAAYLVLLDREGDGRDADHAVHGLMPDARVSR